MRIKLNKPVIQHKMLNMGYTTAQLQRRADVSTYTMYMAMNRGGYVRATTAKKIADVLGCKVDEIALIENKEPTEKGA